MRTRSGSWAVGWRKGGRGWIGTVETDTGTVTVTVADGEAAGAVVVTGGHMEEATDVFFDGELLVGIAGDRYPGGATHGSGCTHSSALAAHLALGFDPLDAARRAKEIASEAVRCGLRDVGSGAGPVDVFGLAGGEMRAKPVERGIGLGP